MELTVKPNVLVSKNSSIQAKPPSLPKPDCLNPPNGTAGSGITPLFTSTILGSKHSATFIARFRSEE